LNQPGPAELVGIGNALIDVFAVVDEELGPFLGIHPGSAVHVDQDRLAAILAGLKDAVAVAGGGAATICKLAAQMDVRTAFVGCVGSTPDGEADPFARRFEDELARAGVALSLSRGSAATGACAVIRMPGGANAIAACPAAALELRVQDIPEYLIRDARVVALDGFILNRKDIVDHVIRLADRHGTVIALDVSSTAIAAQKAAEIAAYARAYPLILFMNEKETEVFCRALDDGAGDAYDPYAPLRSLSADDLFPIIAVKRGDRGSMVFAGGTVHTAPAAAALPFDATGAGDAFAAAFLSAWIRGKSLARCAYLGNRLAREVLRIPGTRLESERLGRFARLLAAAR